MDTPKTRGDSLGSFVGTQDLGFRGECLLMSLQGWGGIGVLRRKDGRDSWGGTEIGLEEGTDLTDREGKK